MPRKYVAAAKPAMAAAPPQAVLASAASTSADCSSPQGQATHNNPAAEARDYEAALNLFKTNKLKDAASAFEAFGKNHPDSTLAPNAQYWLGNTHYAQRDCKKSIDAHKAMVAKWPQHAKAPDSLVGIATCQQELGDAKGARATLETVLAKYPSSPAAATAKQRLKK